MSISQQKVIFFRGSDELNAIMADVSSVPDEHGHYGYVKNNEPGMFEFSGPFPVTKENGRFVVHLPLK